MATMEDYRVTRIARFWINLVLLAALAVGVLLALWLLVSPFVMAEGDNPAQASVPVVVGSSSLAPVLPITVETVPGETFLSPHLVGARGELRFRTTHWGTQFAANLVYLLAVLALLGVFYLLRCMLWDAVQEGPFTPRNVIRLRIVGILFVLIGLLGPLAEYLVARLLLKPIVASQPALSPPLSFNPTMILSGLLFLVLAHIWAYGAQIEQDQSLTI